jgi:hypothetical protein
VVREVRGVDGLIEEVAEGPFVDLRSEGLTDGGVLGGQ